MYDIIPYPNEIKKLNGEAKAPYIIKKELDPSIVDEGYILKVTPEEIVLKASGKAGFFYGEKTFLQMKKQYPRTMEGVYISDAPKYKYRGYMLDCCRHFFTVEEIKKQLDVMALLHLNVFHWHLTEDQGYRIESKKYPKLAEVGSKRAETAGDGIPREGYFTMEQIKEIVEYCDDRCITVIPEFDMPGHSGALMASYPELGCFNKPNEVCTRFGITPYVVCAGKESTYAFYEDLLDEICELFPGKYFHIGGDEALKANWLDCPDCQNKIKELGLKNEEELQGYFMSRIIKMLDKKGKTAMMWNDALEGGNIDGDYIVHYWKCSKKCTEFAINAVKQGKKVVFSPFFNFYLDYPYGMTPLKKTYNVKIDPAMEGSIYGMEAPLWTEHVSTLERVENLTYPRLIAVAERAWSNTHDYIGFKRRLATFVNLLDDYNVGYEKDYDPSFIKGKLSVIKFGKMALTRCNLAFGKLMRVTEARIKAKYKK